VRNSKRLTKWRRSCEARRVRRTILAKRVYVIPLIVFAAIVLWADQIRTARAAFPSGKATPASRAAQGDISRVCEVPSATAALSVPHVAEGPELNSEPDSKAWAQAGTGWIEKDCTHQIDYPKLKTEVRGFWSDSHLYLLFICPYTELNLWLPADHSKDRLKLWDRDVVEFFLGDDWTDIKHYREFEIAPTGDYIDLAIDLNKDSYDANWNSGWQRQGRIDEKRHIWYAAARVPLRAVSEQPVKPGTRWRANLYRIDGLGADPQRHFMCWQPTCVVNRDPNHVPEHFGTLIFTK
jgi:hypothetical protein